MKHLVWMLGALGLVGCSGSVDLGEAAPPGPGTALGSPLQRFAAVPQGMCGLLEDRRAYCWGREGSTEAHRFANLDGVALSADTAGQQVCAVRADGVLACASEYVASLVPRLGVTDAVDVSLGGRRTCTLGADGTVRHWADELCHDDEGDPRAVRLPSPAVAVTCVDDGGCAVTEDGRLFCLDVDRSNFCAGDFQEVPGVNDAAGVTLTMDETCVLHRDGTVSCARTTPGLLRPDLGALGKVDGLSGVVELSSSRIGTCGLSRSGTLKCWGTSQCGSFGISEGCGFTEVPAPIAVQQDIETRRFGMSDGLTCSLDASGDVWCWGFSDWNGTAQGGPLARRIQF